MNKLKIIAARYASALKAAEVIAPSDDGEDRPTATDIWLYKLEDAVASIVKNPNRLNKKKPDGEGYDHFYLYNHRSCLKTLEDVQNAPDDVLLEALGLHNVEEWGWLQFMVRDFAWFSLLAANWGLPSMRTPYGGNSDATEDANEDERRAQAAIYFLELMRERGVDVLADVRASAQAYKEKNNLSEEEFTKWLRGHNDWVYFVYTCESVIIRPEAKGKVSRVQYSGDHRTEFRSEIWDAAKRRRQNWNATHPSDCLQRQKELEREQGLAEEKRAIEEYLQKEQYRRWVAELGTTPDDRLLDGFMEFYGDGKGATGKHDNEGHIEPMKLCIYILANPKVLDLLRLPENHKIGLTVRKYLSWVYI